MSDPRNDELTPGSPAERIGLVWPLTRELASLRYRLPIGFIFVRHTRASGYPVSIAADHWIPAFAGMTKTYSELVLQALADEKARFLLVGAYALAAHGYLRATMDIDIWVMPSPQNAEAVLCALQHFGAPLHDLTVEDLQIDGTIFQIGVAIA